MDVVCDNKSLVYIFVGKIKAGIICGSILLWVVSTDISTDMSTDMSVDGRSICRSIVDR